MSRYPEEVLTRTKKGDIEVRSQIDRGRYVRYNYLHPETGEPLEGGKIKLIPIADGGKTESSSSSPRNRNGTCSCRPPRRGPGRSGTG